MTAGRRDKLVTIQRATAAQAASGQEVDAWTAIGQEWAAVFYGRGDERRQAASEHGTQSATFGMLLNPITSGLKVKDRIVHAAANWDVVGIAPDTPKRGLIEVTAVRAG